MSSCVMWYRLPIAVLVVVSIVAPSPLDVSAQNVATPIQCGTVLEAELTVDNTAHFYSIQLSAGDTIIVRIDPIGQIIDYALDINDPRDHRIHNAGWYYDGRESENSVEVSATGQYAIKIYGDTGRDPIGAYTLSVGCALRNGTVISPGDIVLPSEPVGPTIPEAPSWTTPEFGFAGLPPVDFAGAARLPIPAGIPMTGAVTPTGGEILGYALQGNAGDVVELTFTRLSGNLNLGLIVLSEGNELAFQASLITTTTLSTQFTLPSTGEYTAGVFRVDLLAPAVPEATAFQIQAVVNPPVP